MAASRWGVESLGAEVAMPLRYQRPAGRFRLTRPTPGSPQHRHAVGGDPLVARDEREALAPRLGYEHPVERICVMARQGTGEQRVPREDGQFRETPLPHRVEEVLRYVELALRSLDRDLPDGRDAEKDSHFGVGDLLAYQCPDAPVVPPPPEQCMGIEQQPLQSRVPKRRSSSSSGSSKSSLIQILPARSPGTRRVPSR